MTTSAGFPLQAAALYLNQQHERWHHKPHQNSTGTPLRERLRAASREPEEASSPINNARLLARTKD